MLQTVHWRNPYRHSSGPADADLIAMVLSGDRDAQEEFVRRFETLIRVVLSRMELSIPDQEDLFQQVFVHLWEEDFRRLHKWDSSKGRLCSFVAVVAAHLAYDFLRRKSSCTESIDMTRCLNVPARTEELPVVVFQHAQADAVRRALASLLPRDANLLQQRHLCGRSYREIASDAGMTVNHVGVALARAESRLRAELRRSCPDLFDIVDCPSRSEESSQRARRSTW